MTLGKGLERHRSRSASLGEGSCIIRPLSELGWEVPGTLVPLWCQRRGIRASLCDPR